MTNHTPPSSLSKRDYVITVKQALNALCVDGYAKCWRRHTERCRYRWSDYSLDSPTVSVENETLATRTFLYFRCNSERLIGPIVECLIAAGGQPTVCLNGGPNQNAHIEMQVSRFKGYRWWN